MLLTLIAFAFALGLLVTFHELGHYWLARLCGVRVLRFSLGFGRILLRRTDRHGTEWALSAIPLGGYVKMLDRPLPQGGDAAEAVFPHSSGQTASAQHGKAFESLPLSRRVAIVAAGPLANLLLAVFIYAFLGMWGTLEPAARLAAPAAGTPAAMAGIAGGSSITAVDGVPVASWTQARWRLIEPLALGGELNLTVLGPDGVEQQALLHLPVQSMAPDAPDPLLSAGLQLAPARPVLGNIMPDSPAWSAGLEPGDEIIAIGGLLQPDPQEFIHQVQAHPGEPMRMQVLRDGTGLMLSITPAEDTAEDGRIVGRIGAMIRGERDLVMVRLGPLDSLWAGVQRTGDVSLLSLRMLGRMVIGDVSWKNISGPVTIAEYAGQTARVGLDSYLGFLALISISIGILNLLPIPMLDGGHLLFYLVEALRGGRPVSERTRDLSLRLGMSMVAGLMMLALFNDFSRLFR